MSHSLRLPLQRKIVSLKVHSVPSDPNGGESASANWLLDLGSIAARRESDRKISLQCIEAIGQALTKIPTQVEENLAAIASLATELGLALAGEIVGDAINKELLDPARTVLRALESVTLPANDAKLTIFLSPTDFSAVVSELQSSPELAAHAEQAEFVVDHELGQGAVRIDTGAGRLRYEPREVLKLLCDEVRKEAES